MPLTIVRVSLGLLMLPRDAVICEVPAEIPVARPVFAPMVATAVLEEVQVTLVVMSLVAIVAVGARGGELLGLRLTDRRIGRCHGDGLQRNRMRR